MAVVESFGEVAEAAKNWTILTDLIGILPVVNRNCKTEIHRKRVTAFDVYTSNMFLILPLYPFKDKDLPWGFLASSKNENLILMH